MAKDFGKHLSDRMKRLNPQNVPSAVGIGWYRPETYDRCLAIFDDASDLPDTFDEWLALAEKTERQLKSQGMKVVRVEIDPDTFPQWCTDEGYSKIDKHARMAFGNMMAMKSLRKKRG